MIGAGFDTATVTAQGLNSRQTRRTRRTRGGDSHRPHVGTFRGQPPGTFTWPRTKDDANVVTYAAWIVSAAAPLRSSRQSQDLGFVGLPGVTPPKHEVPTAATEPSVSVRGGCGAGWQGWRRHSAPVVAPEPSDPFGVSCQGSVRRGLSAGADPGPPRWLDQKPVPGRWWAPRVAAPWLG